MNIVTNYFERGYVFRYSPVSKNQDTNGTVFLIHGWGVRATSMESIAHALNRKGYEVFNYDYPSSEHTIQDHAEIFLDYFRKVGLVKNHHKIYFVTHSMGGLLLRAALAKMSEEECKQIEAIIMLGPPNKGSKWANVSLITSLFRRSLSLKDMTPGKTAYAENIPAPVYLPPVGIITGFFDGKVSFANTGLPNNQPFERITVFCTHPGLRNPMWTLAPIITFFKTKHFFKKGKKHEVQSNHYVCGRR